MGKLVGAACLIAALLFGAMIASGRSGDRGAGSTPTTDGPRSPVATIAAGGASPPKTATDDLPAGVYRTKGGHVAATTKAKLEKAVEYVAQGDSAAFERYLKTEPGVIVLAEGAEVIVVDADGLLGSTVKIRKRGEVAELWTVRGALDIR